MEISKFKELLTNGFDVEFNIEDVFYSFTKVPVNGEIRYYIGNENYTENHNFSSIDELLAYKINGIELSKIVESIDEEEVNY